MNIALIPLRGGSKSIPFKNIKAFCGKPLCQWVVEAALASEVFDQVVISTDSEQIADVVCSFGLPIDVLMRPAELATDSATTESVMLHAATQYDFNVLATIQATSPLTRPADFIKAMKLFQTNGADSLLTCVRIKRFFWTDDGRPINYDPTNRPMRQDFNGTLMENGAFYFTKRDVLIEHKCRLAGKICVYEMPEYMTAEIDEPEDWAQVEVIMRSENRSR